MTSSPQRETQKTLFAWPFQKYIESPSSLLMPPDFFFFFFVSLVSIVGDCLCFALASQRLAGHRRAAWFKKKGKKKKLRLTNSETAATKQAMRSAAADTWVCCNEKTDCFIGRCFKLFLDRKKEKKIKWRPHFNLEYVHWIIHDLITSVIKVRECLI